MITKGWYRRQRVRAALRFAAEAIHDRRGVPSRAESPHVRLIAGMKESKHESLRQAAIWELSEEGRLKLGKNSELVELAPGAAGGLSQDKYSSRPLA